MCRKIAQAKPNAFIFAWKRNLPRSVCDGPLATNDVLAVYQGTYGEWKFDRSDGKTLYKSRMSVLPLPLPLFSADTISLPSEPNHRRFDRFPPNTVRLDTAVTMGYGSEPWHGLRMFDPAGSTSYLVLASLPSLICQTDHSLDFCTSPNDDTGKTGYYRMSRTRTWIFSKTGSTDATGIAEELVRYLTRDCCAWSSIPSLPAVVMRTVAKASTSLRLMRRSLLPNTFASQDFSVRDPHLPSLAFRKASSQISRNRPDV